MAYISETLHALQAGRFSSSRLIHEKQIYFIIFALDLLALLLAYRVSFPVAEQIREIVHQALPTQDLYPKAEMREIVYFCMSLGIMFFLFLQGHYTRRVPWWSQIQQVLKVFIFAVLVDGFTSYALDLHYSRILIATNWVLAFDFFILGRFGVNIIKSRSDNWQIPTVIMADADTATDTLYALSSDGGMGLRAQYVLIRDQSGSFDREELPGRYKNVQILSEINFESFIKKNSDLFYVVSLENLAEKERDLLLKIFHQNKIGYALMPVVSGSCIYQAAPDYFFGNDIILLKTKKPTISPLGRLLKRSMDIAGASFALAVFTIPMLLVALMLKLEGQGGSPLYAGKRVGQNGRLFRCWKFRTMEPGTDHLLHEYLAANPEARAHWERYFKIPDDPRVQTRTARFIRRASIDELPQFWNVLKGDMSLVGPRPILENEIAAYGDQIDEYLSVKPGITGLWQASGRNGTSFQRRVIWDSWYIRNWTLWGDIVIILKTIQAVLSRSGAN